VAVNSQYLRIPIRNDYQDISTDPLLIPSFSPHRELVIDLPALSKIILNELNSHNHRLSSVLTTGIIIVGSDIIAEVSNMSDIPDTFYSDHSASSCIKFYDYGIIFSGAAKGVTFLNQRPNVYSPKKSEISDRERLSSAHIQAVVKLIAQVGNVQKGEYRDGWMACLRQVCLSLGVDVPSFIIPFEGMGQVLSNDEIIRNLELEMKNAS
jgi:hypothetical protein